MTQPAKPKEPNGSAPVAPTGRRLPFEPRQLKSLVDLMVENDLSRLELREGDTHILLRRGQPVVVTGAAPAAMPAIHAAPAAAGPAATTNPGPAGGAPATTETFIRSPMVGTVVCLLEAMKVYNEIKAEVSGRISKVLVKNSQAVEFDQPLFALEPA